MALKHQAAGAVRASLRVYTKKWSFFAFAVLVFAVSFSALNAVGLTPDPVEKASPLVAMAATPAKTASALKSELPVRIEIPTIGVKVSVANPETTNIEKLDAALLHGAVRYPTSAKLGENGNVIVLAHSSYLPIVNNPAFKAFNSIQNLKVGDRITVYSGTTAYTYAVETVVKAKAEDAAIPLSVEGSKLTLATCDSFGTKSGRFVVTATLVDSKAIGS